VSVSWVDPDEVRAVPGDPVRSADWNTVLDNLQFLADPPRCAVRKTSSQSIPTSSDTTLTWDEDPWAAQHGMWSAQSPSKIVIPRAGVYRIICSVLWAGTTSQDLSFRRIFLQRGAQGGPIRLRGSSSRATNPHEHQLIAEANLAEGWELELQVRQTTGSSLNVEPTRTLCTVVWEALPPGT
jgi:hypothetical protein